MVTADTKYDLTLDAIENIQMALEALDKTIYSHIPQGITDEYDKAKILLLGWLEEAEFTIGTY